MSKAIRRSALISVVLCALVLSVLTFTSHGHRWTTRLDSRLSVSPLIQEGRANVTAVEGKYASDLNATARAELGRHAWYLFHTVLARHSEHPTPQEREDLGSWIKYFTKLYPCPECAQHFGMLLKQYPVQTSSRVAAAQWGCAMHNLVNEKLKKTAYDCLKILDDYDCGCGTK